MALDWDVGAIVVDGSKVRVAFSAGQTVTGSDWGDNIIDPAAIATQPLDLEIVDGNAGDPAYFGVVPLRHSELPAPSGLLRLLVKTADGDSADAPDWDNAPVLLDSGLIDLSVAVPNAPIYWPQFPIARYGRFLRLYYEVHGEKLNGALFYSFITNQPSVYQHLAFIEQQEILKCQSSYGKRARTAKPVA